MSPPRRIAVGALVATAAVAVAPSAARAEIDGFGGGSVQATQSRVRSVVNVSAIASGSDLVIGVSGRSSSCRTSGVQALRTPLVESAYPTAFVVGRTFRPRFGRRRGHLRIVVALRFTSTPTNGTNFQEALAGTVRFTGTIPRGRRGHVRCRLAVPVQLRRDTDTVPRPGVGAGVLRAGPTAQNPIQIGFRGKALYTPGSIVLRPVTGPLGPTSRVRLAAAATVLTLCRSRSVPDTPYTDTYALGPIAVTTSGTFRDVARGTFLSGPSRVRYSYLVSGTVGPDGIARGSIRIRERYVRKRYETLTCRSPTVRFVARP